MVGSLWLLLVVGPGTPSKIAGTVQAAPIEVRGDPRKGVTLEEPPHDLAHYGRRLGILNVADADQPTAVSAVFAPPAVRRSAVWAPRFGSLACFIHEPLRLYFALSG